MDQRWYEWALREEKPSQFLQKLIDSGESKLYPEFHQMIGIRQNPIFHREILLELHIMMACDEAKAVADREHLSKFDKLTLMFTMLLHDVAKPSTSIGTFPNIRSPGHDVKGVPLAQNFLYRIDSPANLIELVSIYTKLHMRHYNCKTPKAVNNLIKDLGVGTLQMLMYVIECDYSSRLLPKGLPEKAKEVWRIAHEQQPKPGKHNRPAKLLQGLHLTQMGLKGPIIGQLLQECFRKQLAGEITNTEQALEWAKEQI